MSDEKSRPERGLGLNPFRSIFGVGLVPVQKVFEWPEKTKCNYNKKVDLETYKYRKIYVHDGYIATTNRFVVGVPLQTQNKTSDAFYLVGVIDFYSR